MGTKRVAEGSQAGAEQGYSVDALTKLFGVNRRTLLARLKGATPMKSGAGGGKRYRLSDAVQGFISEPLRGAEVVGLQGVRGRKLAAETELAELKLQKQRGELVQSGDVRQDVVEVIRDLHTRLAVTMPQQLGPRLQAKTAREAAEILSAEVGRVFAELRAEHARYLAEMDAAEGGGGDGDGAGA